jgi:hypothetical protein
MDYPGHSGLSGIAGLDPASGFEVSLQFISYPVMTESLQVLIFYLKNPIVCLRDIQETCVRGDVKTRIYLYHQD